MDDRGRILIVPSAASGFRTPAPLTKAQAQEVADVYNAWRVGNMQDCTIRTPGDIKL